MHNGHVGSAARSNKWACALSRGVCPDRNWVRRTASALFEVDLQSALKEWFLYTMAVWGLLIGGSVNYGFRDGKCDGS